MSDISLLSVIIPVFNEEESIRETFDRLSRLRTKLLVAVETELIFVDDGSHDASLMILSELAADRPYVKVVSFSRNFGHQIAVTAGLDESQGDFVAIIDADLQDPPELIEDMLALANQGYDVVYGKRRSRAGETIFKKVSAAAFYKLLSKLCDIDIPQNTGDFRLISRRVVESVGLMREKHRFLRGMVPWVGFSSIALEYDRHDRFAGETKYPLSKMVSFSATAILSFSRKPLSLGLYLGLIAAALGLLLGAYVVYLKLFTSAMVPGVASILAVVTFFGGVQLIVIGLLGEYIARIFEESKGRPLYIVKQKINA